MSTEEKPQRLSPFLRRFLILKLWLIEKFRFGERQVTLVWAAVIGILGALVTECFRRATDLLHFLFTGSGATIITSFERLPLWQRFLVPDYFRNADLLSATLVDMAANCVPLLRLQQASHELQSPSHIIICMYLDHSRLGCFRCGG